MIVGRSARGLLFSFGTDGLRRDAHVFLARGRFDLDGDLLRAWRSGPVATVG